MHGTYYGTASRDGPFSKWAQRRVVWWTHQMPRLGIDRATKSTGAGADARNFENTGAAGRGRAEIGFFFYCRGRDQKFWNGRGRAGIWKNRKCRGRAGIRGYLKNRGRNPVGIRYFFKHRCWAGTRYFFKYRGRDRTGINNSLITGASLTVSLRSTNIYQLTNHLYWNKYPCTIEIGSIAPPPRRLNVYAGNSSSAPNGSGAFGPQQ